ncbi:unnamed protein product [Arabis nemorensis]|uniref:Uncharacterized protein n=1 Tax=Arabis nemorensis TaxID=586526 RepID=A0A565BAI2_9BRAS|nr:unnamed protein product [Arabis nemorensis]
MKVCVASDETAPSQSGPKLISGQAVEIPSSVSVQSTGNDQSIVLPTVLATSSEVDLAASGVQGLNLPPSKADVNAQALVSPHRTKVDEVANTSPTGPRTVKP